MHSWSKTTRISVMMALDTVFLLIELGVGYYVSSLALIADAFHMLNDIISLAVGLWAVNLARKESNDRYSYGWLRAEILGAFFNSTFLIGLCLTIVLEAIQRFLDPPEITNPEIVLIVGCFGLLSNLVGFWVLGGHGHSHGGHGEEDIEAGHSHEHGHSHVHDEDAVEDDLDNGELCHDEEEAERPQPAADAANASAEAHGRHISFSTLESYRGELLRADHADRPSSRTSIRSKSTAAARGRANSARRVPASIDDISIHPASFRQDLREIISASRSRNIEDEEGDSDDATVGGNAVAGTSKTAAAVEESGSTETTPLIAKTNGNGPSDSPNGKDKATGAHDHHDHHDHGHGADHSHNSGHTGHTHHHARARRDSHGGHHHNAPKDLSKAGGHGHNHGDMGMNAMILHVMGDALGNIGVILTAIIIWKTNWTYRFYADPIVSLFITLIILNSAIPLTKATSKILLQATPDHIDINDIREDIQDLDGVLSCHHVHVWQLSDSQIVASMHIEVSFPISEYGGERYMALAKRVRKCLHAYGIHSATIQPEFRLGTGSGSNQFATASSDDGHGDGHGVGHSHHAANAPSSSAALSSSSTAGASAAPPALSTETTAASATGGAGAVAASGADADKSAYCLLDCVDDCVGQGCCSASRNGSRTGSPPGSDHGHSH